MFLGRNNEIEQMNKRYQKGKFECIVMYGRRRVGKTALINEFCKDKPTIFFSALNASAQENIEALSKAIYVYKEPDRVSVPRYANYDDALEEITRMSEKERLIFVIDEYPYLAKSEPSISSRIQHIIDHVWQHGNLFLILCGSSMSFMENQVLGYQSPLYGRRTAQFKILSFDYLDTGKWFPDYSYEEKAIMYGITGGIPMYLEQFSNHLSVKENLLNNLFDRNAILFEEPSNLLKQELREPATYNAVITAIATGKTKLSEISSTVGMETGLCSKYIANLIALGIIKKETPVTDRNSKRPIYLIEDQFFRFWYTFVPKNMSAILSGRIEQSYHSVIESRLADYMGITFEKMCRDYILYYDKNLPFYIGDVGQWWGGHPKTHKQAQIDVVVTSADSDCGIVGSCKFRENIITEEELYLMEDSANAMGYLKKPYYYLFAKSGFSSSLKDMSNGVSIKLITLKDLYEI